MKKIIILPLTAAVFMAADWVSIAWTMESHGMWKQRDRRLDVAYPFSFIDFYTILQIFPLDNRYNTED